MIKKHPKKAIISSLLILLPIAIGLLLWNKLPDTMTTHWGADGHADGFGSKGFVVFFVPLILFVLHWLCLLFDNGQNDQSPKVQGIVFWIVPAISLFVSSLTYATALGKTVDMSLILPGLFAVMFIFLGNYLPKTKRNRSMGIKIEWTLSNNENWNKTHRMAGKLWVCGGFLVLISMLLPVPWMITVVAAVVIAAVLIPVFYSYHIYKMHLKQGVAYEELPETKTEKLVGKFSVVFIPLLLVALCVLMFTGDVDIKFAEETFRIEATYWSDLEVNYEDIDSIELREEKISGNRVYGFSTARLSLGNFQNEEFGSYTRFAYTNRESCIVLRSGDQVLVITGKDNSETEQWYEQLLEHIS